MAKKKRPVQIEHDEIVRRFAQQLRSVRNSCGMSQADLASKAEVTPTYVSRLESAKVAPGIDLVAKLAAALKVEPGELLPVGEVPDQLPLLKEQAESLLRTLLQTGDAGTFHQLNPFMALLAEAAAKRGGEKPKSG